MGHAATAAWPTPVAFLQPYAKYPYKDPIVPKYCLFSSGACYIIPKHHVLRNTKEFYSERCSKLELELEQQKKINLLAVHELMNDIQLFKNIKNVKELGLIQGMCDKQIARLQAHALKFAEFAPLKKEASLKVIKGGKDE